jgi:hypothetical protein
MADEALMSFNSHIDGKNADVSIYTDRVEWDRKSRMGTGSKVALGVLTAGLSLAKTGVRGSSDSEVMPVKSISSVVVERDGFRQKIKVVASGNTIEFRCSREEADRAKALLTDLMLGRHPSQTLLSGGVAGTLPPPTEAPAFSAAPVPATDMTGQLSKLAEMRASGVLTDAEFATAKARLLA